MTTDNAPRDAVMEAARNWAQFADDWHNWAGENPTEWNDAEAAVRAAVERAMLDARIAEHTRDHTTCLYEHHEAMGAACPRWMQLERQRGGAG